MQEITEITLTLVVPCYNEEENVEKFYDCVKKTFEGKINSYEVVFVNDGSSDNTLSILKKIREKEKGNIQIVSFSRNFGKESAIYAGLSMSKGEMTCIIDGDLQQHPNVVVQMFEILQHNKDIDGVVAYQENRKEDKIISHLKSSFYRLIDKLSELKFVNGASDFRLIRRNILEAVLRMTEYHRFSKGIFSWVGFNLEYIPYVANEREGGKSKWGIRKLIRYAFDGIMAFSTVPLKLSTFMGLITALSSIIYLIFTVAQTIICGITVPGYATIVTLILLIGGLNLFCLGIIGEYLAKVYVQSKNRPIYIVKEHLGLKDDFDKE